MRPRLFVVKKGFTNESETGRGESTTFSGTQSNEDPASIIYKYCSLPESSQTSEKDDENKHLIDQCASLIKAFVQLVKKL